MRSLRRARRSVLGLGNARQHLGTAHEEFCLRGKGWDKGAGVALLSLSRGRASAVTQMPCRTQKLPEDGLGVVNTFR